MCTCACLAVRVCGCGCVCFAVSVLLCVCVCVCVAVCVWLWLCGCGCVAVAVCGLTTPPRTSLHYIRKANGLVELKLVPPESLKFANEVSATATDTHMAAAPSVIDLRAAARAEAQVRQAAANGSDSEEEEEDHLLSMTLLFRNQVRVRRVPSHPLGCQLAANVTDAPSPSCGRLLASACS